MSVPVLDTAGHVPASEALLPSAGGTATGPPPVPAERFAALLAAQETRGGTATATSGGWRGVPTGRLPSLTMDQMISLMAGGGPGLSTAPNTLLGAGIAPGALNAPPVMPGAPTSGPIGDDWGVAADRPLSAMSGPGAQVLTAGERYLGVPYRWGGTDPASGFDCSGFVQQVYADLGIRLPRVSVDQSRAGVAVPGLAAAQPGDLVFWSGNGRRPNHIGIYAGEGRMLVAPRTGDVVRYQEITRTPDAVRRILG